MFVKTYCAALSGLEVSMVTVEAFMASGMQYHLTGLGDTAVKESHDRIYAALTSIGKAPKLAEYTINLAPADLKKEGSGYDLSLAMALLALNGHVKKEDIKDYVFLGELSLDGTIQPIKGALPISIEVRKGNYKGLIVPEANIREAAVVNKLNVYAVRNIREVIDFLNGNPNNLQPTIIDTRKEFAENQNDYTLDFADVKGQEMVKRAMEVAAAGGHNMIMIGPPGSGKSMMAKRLPTILPPLSMQESLETTQIYSIAGMLDGKTSLMTRRPFRSPHHTITQVALVGGGTNPKPGEISLAHNGVLFADELPEFNKASLEVLRQPLEDHVITIARANYRIDYPCSFMFVASMNPCPCGYYGDPYHECICSTGNRLRYMSRISGPIYDRFDIQCSISPVPFKDLANIAPGESSAEIRKRVIAARQIQQERFHGISGIHCNAQMNDKQIHQFAEPDEQGKEVLHKAMTHYQFSARAYSRIIKLARTIADLAGAEKVQAGHIQEAILYRGLDKGHWGEV